MAKRYELSHRQWEGIKDFLPGKATDRGRTASDNRQFVNGVLWILRSGARWGDLYPPATATGSVSISGLRAGRELGWEQVFARLTADRHNDYLLLDSTLVRAHQQAATGKGGIRSRLWGVPEAD